MMYDMPVAWHSMGLGKCVLTKRPLTENKACYNKFINLVF